MMRIMVATGRSDRTGVLSSFLRQASIFGCDQFLDRAVCLIDRRISVGPSPRIGVGNGDPPERRPPDDVRLLVLVPKGIEQGIVLVGVAVRPAIDGDGDDVGCWIEASWTQHAVELVADVPLKDLEACAQ